LFADRTSKDDAISETILSLAGAKIYMEWTLSRVPQQEYN